MGLKKGWCTGMEPLFSLDNINSANAIYARTIRQSQGLVLRIKFWNFYPNQTQECPPDSSCAEAKIHLSVDA